MGLWGWTHRRRRIGNPFEGGYLAVGLERTLNLAAFDRYDRPRLGCSVAGDEQAKRENE
jgi:hypothetical protein